MPEGFIPISPWTYSAQIFNLIDKEWFLITAGNESKMNTMTASWGGFGILWNKPVCFTFVRPTRHTWHFMEEAAGFSLSFFDKEYRKKLSFLGTVSGRDRDKIGESGLTPLPLGNSRFAFNEAKLIFECNKLYFNDLQPENFLGRDIIGHYKDRDFHRMYIGEIINIFEKQLP